jgi:hypothetical protein
VADVPGSRKLVALTVSFGDHSRTILARTSPGVRPCSWSTSSRDAWRGSSSRACCSTSATPTA